MNLAKWFNAAFLVFVGVFVGADAWAAANPDVIAEISKMFGVASVSNADEVRAYAYLPAVRLKEQGFRAFAGIDLDELWIRFQKVKVSAVTKINLRSAEGRTGSVNLTGDHWVVINYPELELLTGPQRQMLLMHEFFGAVGYQDDNYEFSAMFAAAYSQPRPSLFNNKLQGYLSRLAKNMRRQTKTKDTVVARGGGGGISGVGGGGDGVAIDIKRALLQASEIWFEAGQADTIFEMHLKILKLRIETSHESGDLDSLRIEESKQSKKRERYVIVPRNLWREEGRHLVMAKLFLQLQQI